MRGLLLSLLVASLFARDWTGWRGPDRDGVFAEPASWPGKLTPGWKIPVGEGHSSPVSGGGRIYAFARQGGGEVVLAVDPATGKILWQQSYPAAYNVNPAATRHGPGPKSTPLYDNGRLYTFGISGILSCWDAAGGKLLWRKEFAGQFKQTSPLFGTAASPIMDRGLLIVHVGGHDDGALTAFDPATGAVKWAWKGDGPAYSTPIVFDAGGTRQVVTQSQNYILSVDEKDGALLWQMAFKTPFVQNIVTPVAYKDTIIFSGLQNPTMALRLLKKSGSWTTEKVWESTDSSMYMNSPVLEGNVLFGFTNRNKGQFFAINADTGKTLWLGAPRQGENASTLISAGSLVFLTNDAELTVAKPTGARFESIRHYTVADSPVWAHPLFVGGGIVVKDAKTLSLWRLQ